MSRRSAPDSIRAENITADQTGFTLVELMVVLAVVVILLMIAIPSFADLLDRSRVRGAAGAAVSLLADARGAAVQSNRDVAIRFGGTDPAWCVGANGAATPTTLGNMVPTAAACNSTCTDCTLLNGQQTSTAVDSSNYSGVTMGTRPSTFIIDGRFGDLKPLASSSVTFTSPKGTYQIQMTVAPLGQATLCIPSGQKAIPGISSC